MAHDGLRKDRRAGKSRRAGGGWRERGSGDRGRGGKIRCLSMPERGCGSKSGNTANGGKRKEFASEGQSRSSLRRGSARPKGVCAGLGRRVMSPGAATRDELKLKIEKGAFETVCLNGPGNRTRNRAKPRSQ